MDEGICKSAGEFDWRPSLDFSPMLSCMSSRVVEMSLNELLLPWNRNWLSSSYVSCDPSAGWRPRSVSFFIPRTMLSSPNSSVSEESDSDEQDASWSESEPESWPPRLRALAAFGVFFPAALRDLTAALDFSEVLVGQALFGGGAVRDTRDCFLLIVGDGSTALGESERALSEEEAGWGGSFLHESRTMGGPSSAEKSASGRSCEEDDGSLSTH